MTPTSIVLSLNIDMTYDTEPINGVYTHELRAGREVLARVTTEDRLSKSEALGALISKLPGV